MKKWHKIEDLLKEIHALPCDRAIKYIVIHHTFEPNHGNWRGDRSADGVKAYWMGKTKDYGWHNPLGASFIVAPGGEVYQPFPLSQIVNANSDGEMNRHAVSIETVGCFDTGHDTLVNPQRHALLGLVGGVLARFGLSEECIHYHAEFNHGKTCPGTGFPSRETFRKDAHVAKGWVLATFKG